MEAFFNYKHCVLCSEFITALVGFFVVHGLAETIPENIVILFDDLYTTSTSDKVIVVSVKQFENVASSLQKF